MISRFVIPSLLLLLAAPALAAKPSADEAYEAARTSYRALKGDAARRKFRHHWLNVARKFEAVAAKHPKSPRAPEALYTAGELMAELSRISGQPSDLEAAVTDYQKLLDGHPKHQLADDAALELARVAVNREDDVPAARKFLERGLTANPKGDRAKEMKALLASLGAAPAPKAEKEPRPRPAPARELAAAKEPASAKEASPAKAAPPQGSPALAEAIAKLARVSPLKGQPTADEPSKPAAKLPANVGELAAVADEPETAPAKPPMATLERVQERLRGVRVGEPKEEPKKKIDEKLATARLRRVAKDEEGAEMTLAEQLGLKVRKVVIDAGHGGHDTGAIGAKGTREKDVTLAISTRLAELLTEAGLEVLLTRDDDTFVRLEDRAKLANEARGDLFISIHCNSAPSSKLRGIETYTLNTSSDRYSIRLAARENASSEKGISDLQFILADLATKANTEESTRLATKVQAGLVSSLRAKHPDVRDLGNKEALFYVLLGAKMPAILIEASFLSNPGEELLLSAPGYQEEVAHAIAGGVQDFLDDRMRLAKVD